MEYLLFLLFLFSIKYAAHSISSSQGEAVSLSRISFRALSEECLIQTTILSPGEERNI